VASAEIVRALRALAEADVDFIVVGMAAAVLQAVPMVTFDVDIVHRRSPENIEKLLAWLLAHGAYHRLDLADRRLPPTREQLAGSGHVNLRTTFGSMDCLGELEIGQGYEELEPDTVEVDLEGTKLLVLSLERVIMAKTRANRLKDRAALPVLLATLDAHRRRGS
jgi:hypothetical protein